MDLHAEPGSSRHVRRGRDYKTDQPDDAFNQLPAGSSFDPETDEKLLSLIRRTQQQSDSETFPEPYLRGIALISRAAPIAADHEISSRRYPRRSTGRTKTDTLYHHRLDLDCRAKPNSPPAT